MAQATTSMLAGLLSSSFSLDGVLVVCFVSWMVMMGRRKGQGGPSLLHQCMALFSQPLSLLAQQQGERDKSEQAFWGGSNSRKYSSSTSTSTTPSLSSCSKIRSAPPSPPPPTSSSSPASAAAAVIAPPPPSQVPTKPPPPSHSLCHIAMIMDGNRRFGRERFSDPLRGHQEGGKALSNVTAWCLERGIEVLTVYAFSTENWRRDPAEIASLMGLFCKYAENMKAEALERGVRVRVLSTDPSLLPSHVQASMRDLETATEGCSRLTLNLCVSYGGRGEIAHACKAIARQVAAGQLAPEAVDENLVGEHLLTRGLPDPDLLIRTSGECRLSNFLLYQLAYAEMVFLDKYWPQITAKDLDAILHDYIARDRRYGS